MAFQPVPGTAQIAFKFSGTPSGALEGAKAQFNLYVESQGVPWAQPTLDLLADFAEDWYTAGKGTPAVSLASLISGAWTCVDLSAKDLSVANGIVANKGNIGPGTRSLDPVPPSAPAWSKFIGATGALPADGGCFLPAGCEPDLVGDDWVVTFRNDVNTCLIQFMQEIDVVASGGNAVWRLVIVSRSLTTDDSVRQARAQLREAIAATRRATALVNPVVSIQTRLLIGSQRDRRRPA